jgi:hypothetical protein
MSDTTVSQTLVSDPPVFTDQQIFLNLLRQEWRLCRGAVTALAMLWVIGLWVLVIFNHPGWLLAVGLLHLLLVAPAQAGRDVLDGTEEFSFTQPPGRGPLYLARLSLGLVFLLANGVLGGLAIAGDLPQRIWSLCFSGGLTEPFGTHPEFLWYGLAVLVPTAAHGVTFVFAANAGSRAGVNLAWLAGILVAGIVTGVGLLLENVLWQAPNGFLACPALLVTSVLPPLAGYFAYLRKEATGSGGAGSLGGGSGLWIVAIIFGLLLFLLLGFFWMRTSAVRSMPEPPRPVRDVPVNPVPPLVPTPERNSN